MNLWKPAVLGAVLAVAACQPVGAPMGEARIAGRIADTMVTKDMLGQVVSQQVQGLMYQGTVQQDQVNQVAISVSHEMEARLPEIKKELVKGLTEQFNVKELELFDKLLNSKEGKALGEKQAAATQPSMEALQKIATDATTKAVGRLNSAWPVAPKPAPPGGPQGMQGLPGMDGMPPQN